MSTILGIEKKVLIHGHIAGYTGLWHLKRGKPRNPDSIGGYYIFCSAEQETLRFSREFDFGNDSELVDLSSRISSRTDYYICFHDIEIVALLNFTSSALTKRNPPIL